MKIVKSMKTLDNALYDLELAFIKADDLLYEFALDLKTVKYRKKTVLLPLTDSEDDATGYDVKIGNVTSMSWQLEHPALEHYLDSGWANITNIRLLREYVEKLYFAVDIQFSPNCRLTMRMPQGCDPLLEIIKVTRQPLAGG